MRKDLIESALIGGSVGLLAIGIHTWTDSASTPTQVLALFVTGVVLAGVQLALAYRRSRKPGPAQEAPAEIDQTPARRNQFLRELASDWTGLEGPRPERPDAPANPTTEPPSMDQNLPPAP